jgi:hypothetical protein
VTPTPWTEEYQVEYLDMNHRMFDRIDAVAGEQMWNFADFATTRPSTPVRRTHPAPSLAAEGHLIARPNGAAVRQLPRTGPPTKLVAPSSGEVGDYPASQSHPSIHERTTRSVRKGQ